MSDYEQFSQAPLGDNILAQIAGVARDIVDAQDEVEKAEEELKRSQTKLKALQETILPELMENAGQTELTTIDGLKISIKDMVRGQPTKDKAKDAYKWLRDKGHGGIIKTVLEADLGKPDEKDIKKAVAALNKLGIKANAKEAVHWQTLGALVRELLARGDDVPLETLGVHMWKMAEVKPKG